MARKRRRSKEDRRHVTVGGRNVPMNIAETQTSNDGIITQKKTSTLVLQSTNAWHNGDGIRDDKNKILSVICKLTETISKSMFISKLILRCIISHCYQNNELLPGLGKTGQENLLKFTTSRQYLDDKEENYTRN